MKLYSMINDGLFQTIHRLAGTTTNTYSFKNLTSDLNDTMDWYLQLAFKSDGQWNFDDIGKTSPPIDTQNIVSGTNRYKISSFTEKLLDLIKLEILHDDATGHELIPETLDSFGSILGSESGVIGQSLGGSFQDIYIDAPSGTPTHYIKYGDFIYLRPNPNYSETFGLKAFFHRPLTKFEFVSCSIANTTGIVTATAHGLAIGDTVIFESDGTLNTGVTADLQYYVIAGSFTVDTFTVSLTLGGTAITVSSTGSGCHFLKTSGEPGIVSIHHQILCRKTAMTYMNFNNSNGIFNSKLSLVAPMILNDQKMIEEYYSSRGKDIRNRLQVFQQDNR